MYNIFLSIFMSDSNSKNVSSFKLSSKKVIIWIVLFIFALLAGISGYFYNLKLEEKASFAKFVDSFEKNQDEKNSLDLNKYQEIQDNKEDLLFICSDFYSRDINVNSFIFSDEEREKHNKYKEKCRDWFVLFISRVSTHEKLFLNEKNFLSSRIDVYFNFPVNLTKWLLVSSWQSSNLISNLVLDSFHKIFKIQWLELSREDFSIVNRGLISIDISWAEMWKEYKIEINDKNIENFDYIIEKSPKISDDKLVFVMPEKTFEPEFSFEPIDIKNWYKDILKIDFSKAPLYNDLLISSKEKFDKRIDEIKENLISKLEIKWNISIKKDDIFVDKTFVKIELNWLESNRKYSVKLQDFPIIYWYKTSKAEIEFTTTSRDFLTLDKKNPASLYKDTNTPEFVLNNFANLDEEISMKICRVSTDNYAKIEVYNSFLDYTKPEYWADLLPSYSQKINNFVLSWIDEIDAFECNTKKINLSWKDKLTFDFWDVIWTPSRSWLYFATFEDSKFRKVWDKVLPIQFFGIIDSHITMKTSSNWETFFFVNDFSWNPLPGQKVKVYVNDKKLHSSKYNEISSFDFLDYDNDFYSKVFEVWTTNQDWVLTVNLNDEKYFWGTFNSNFYIDHWNTGTSLYNSNTYKTLFVSSSSQTNLTYNSSKWNSWIELWNFWYDKEKDVWFFPNRDNYSSEYIHNIDESYKLHSYADRKLYLPWEFVHLKTIVRKVSNLWVPDEWKEFEYNIYSPDGEKAFSWVATLNEFWSFSVSYKIPKDAELWRYRFLVGSSWRYLDFNVEEFKKPKFESEIILTTNGLNSNNELEVEEFQTNYSYETEKKGNFSIFANISSKYFSWAKVANWDITYKLYVQDYYGDSHWDDCFYGCYYEPKSYFYTSWDAKLDENWNFSLDIPIDFSSFYADKKYILEVWVTDSTWERTYNSSSIVAKLPSKYKNSYNDRNSLKIINSRKIFKQWEKTKLDLAFNSKTFDKDFENRYFVMIENKNYLDTKKESQESKYSPAYSQKTFEEVFERVIMVNKDNFELNKDWTISTYFTPKSTWEYIISIYKVPYISFRKLEYETAIYDGISSLNLWKELSDNSYSNKLRNIRKSSSPQDLDFDEFISDIEKAFDKANKEGNYPLINKNDSTMAILNNISPYYNPVWWKNLLQISWNIYPSSYKSFLSYGKSGAKNPDINDNKLYVTTEKDVYKIWETAKLLIRLPFSKWKILLTREKNTVENYEIFDIDSNLFYHEFEVTSEYMPNSYIWVVAIDTENELPKYMLWYAEVVIDKSDMKSFIEIETDKDEYKPRDEVKTSVEIKDANWKPLEGEFSVMVVDEALISLWWNVNLNILESIYSKINLYVETSITNVSMLYNFYFARKWIVWWSWYWDFKWWEASITTRSIFKNTAFYEPSLRTDKNWKADFSFVLPDNLTNFRIIIVSNTKNNNFWYSNKTISVRKNVLIEDQTPMIIRKTDSIEILANIFNNTDKEVKIKADFESEDFDYKWDFVKLDIPAFSSETISFPVDIKNYRENLEYTIKALWDSSKNSDIIKNSIKYAKVPSISKYEKFDFDKNGKFSINIGENIDYNDSEIDIIFSNSKVWDIFSIANSLEKYPYWCIEQTSSSTLPNAILYSLSKKWNIPNYSEEKVVSNIKDWLDRIKKMQTWDWWFGYWPWENSSNFYGSMYALDTMLKIKELTWISDEDTLSKAISYIEKYKKSDEEYYSKYYSDRNDAMRQYILAKVWSDKFDVKMTTKIIEKFDKNDINSAYLYALEALLINDKDKYYSYLTKILENYIPEENLSYSWYSDTTALKIVSIALKYSENPSKEFKYFDSILEEFSSQSYNSYYYSTRFKSRLFEFFTDYLEEKKWKWKIKLTIWDKVIEQDFSWDFSLIKQRFKLSDITDSDQIKFDLEVSWDDTNISFIKDFTYENPLLIEPFSNKINIKREIYELDEDNLSKCELESTNDRKKSYYNRSNSSPYCEKIFKLKTDNLYKKWNIYKVKLTSTINSDLDSSSYKDFVIEDYMPSWFSHINPNLWTLPKFIKGENFKYRGYYDYAQYSPEAYFSHIKYISGYDKTKNWDKNITNEYFVVAKNKWDFLMPPSSAYFMYSPQYRANSAFSRITIK